MAGKIRNTNLNQSVISGHTENVTGQVATDDKVLIFDTSTNSIRKTNTSNIGLQAPTITNVSPTSVQRLEGAGTVTITVTGTGFNAGTTAKLITNGGSNVSFNSVTIDSETQLTCVANRSVFLNANEPYDVNVVNGSGLSVTAENQINVDGAPVFVTAAGSLGSTRGGGDFIIEAYDPESGSDPSFVLESGSFPPGMSITNIDSGRCTIGGVISPTPSSDTTYTFTIKANDANSNVSFREFSITALGPSYTTFTADGTFSVPSGLTAVDVLVVAGGGGSQGLPGSGINNPDHIGNNAGGGAGGLIFMPGYPVTPGGTVSVTVGNGGSGSSGQDSVFGTLTADGGGSGKMGFYIIGYQPGTPGGSGGGGGRGRDSGGPAGTGQQPTQPGNSGAYGFGNPGGSQGGGGGGAQQPGAPGTGGKGGDGRAYTIGDGSTPVVYAGGGGGVSGVGGDGGGGPNPAPTVPNPKDGLANRGGGGRGGSQSAGPENGPKSDGGSGVVIVKT